MFAKRTEYMAVASMENGSRGLCVKKHSLGCNSFHDESASSDDADGPAEVNHHLVQTQLLVPETLGVLDSSFESSTSLLQVLGQAVCF